MRFHQDRPGVSHVICDTWPRERKSQLHTVGAYVTKSRLLGKRALVLCEYFCQANKNTLLSVVYIILISL